jgi:hypothetical protein
MNNKKIFVSQWVSDMIGAGIFLVFCLTVAVALVIAFYQVRANGEYAAEYTGIVNNLIVYLLGVFSGIIGVLWGIKQGDDDDVLESMLSLPTRETKETTVTETATTESPRFEKAPITSDSTSNLV